MTFCFVLLFPIYYSIARGLFFLFNEKYYIISVLNLSGKKRERETDIAGEREETTLEAEPLNRLEVIECRSQVKGWPPKGAGNIFQGDHTGRAGDRKARWSSCDCLDFLKDTGSEVNSGD